MLFPLILELFLFNSSHYINLSLTKIHRFYTFTGYFFNPQFTDGHISAEIRLRLKNVIERLAENTDEAIWATNQVGSRLIKGKTEKV